VGHTGETLMLLCLTGVYSFCTTVLLQLPINIPTTMRPLWYSRQKLLAVAQFLENGYTRAWVTSTAQTRSCDRHQMIRAWSGHSESDWSVWSSKRQSTRRLSHSAVPELSRHFFRITSSPAGHAVTSRRDFNGFLPSFGNSLPTWTRPFRPWFYSTTACVMKKKGAATAQRTKKAVVATSTAATTSSRSAQRRVRRTALLREKLRPVVEEKKSSSSRAKARPTTRKEPKSASTDNLLLFTQHALKPLVQFCTLPSVPASSLPAMKAIFKNKTTVPSSRKRIERPPRINGALDSTTEKSWWSPSHAANNSNDPLPPSSEATSTATDATSDRAGTIATNRLHPSQSTNLETRIALPAAARSVAWTPVKEDQAKKPWWHQ
jgi:hypothetical protein